MYTVKQFSFTNIVKILFLPIQAWPFCHYVSHDFEISSYSQNPFIFIQFFHVFYLKTSETPLQPSPKLTLYGSDIIISDQTLRYDLSCYPQMNTRSCRRQNFCKIYHITKISLSGFRCNAIYSSGQSDQFTFEKKNGYHIQQQYTVIYLNMNAKCEFGFLSSCNIT